MTMADMKHCCVMRDAREELKRSVRIWRETERVASLYFITFSKVYFLFKWNYVFVVCSTLIFYILYFYVTAVDVWNNIEILICPQSAFSMLNVNRVV